MRKPHEVFGVSPNVNQFSYVDRGKLDAKLAKLVERKNTHIAIRGASKTGKSWLRQKILTNALTIQCRHSYTTVDIYRDILSALDITITLERSVTKSYSGKISAAGEAGFKLLAKVMGLVEIASGSQENKKDLIIGRNIEDLKFISEIIIASGRSIVIEDFHYLKIDQQKNFAFDLKTLWDYSTFIIVIGVWISENMLITLNPDLSHRIEEISVNWSADELKQVFNQGCSELKISPSENVVNKIVEISYENVGLLQKIALRFIDDELNIDTSKENKVDSLQAIDDAAMHIAEQLNALYQSFAKRVCDGIRSRKNSTGIYAYAMAAIISAKDNELINGLGVRPIYDGSHARQNRIQMGNLKVALSKFADLQIDEDGRGIVIAYDEQNEKVNVIDRQLLLYRKYATVKWPWEELIVEVADSEKAFD
jgi:sorbitol-specific phosphotransferase system component IIA